MGVFDYHRRRSCRVDIGDTPLGREFPIRVQSMTSTSTMDTPGSVAQAAAIVDAGGEYVRLTAQGVREARNLADIRKEFRLLGYTTPLVADIHFNPKAALEAAAVVEKVRINPGNFVDPARTFKSLSYTDEEYSREIDRIEQALLPLIEVCRDNSTAIRIGVNHGSLSDRIMSRYGDTPAGMVESAMEFLRLFVKHNFLNVVISIKASNTVVMTTTVRRLVAAMDAEDMHFPLHLGVTEAGEGEDGRVKSAVGIGSLLHLGIGDTIRVSLSEAPEAEIPVAKMLTEHIEVLKKDSAIVGELYPDYNWLEPAVRISSKINGIGGGSVPVAVGVDSYAVPVEMLQVSADMPLSEITETIAANPDKIVCLFSEGINAPGRVRAALHAIVAAGLRNPVIIKFSYPADISDDQLAIVASADFGYLLLDGFIDGIWVDVPGRETSSLSLAILQAARLRFSHTEYISCPGCGRTLFDLQSTVAEIKRATSHLPSMKIGVMGCIVNGPGEMADADYGYVGAAKGCVSLYRGKECVQKNIPSQDALAHLIELLKADGRWIEPPTCQ